MAQKPARTRTDEGNDFQRKLIRFPVPVLNAVARLAKRDRRSLNAQVIYALESFMRNENAQKEARR